MKTARKIALVIGLFLGTAISIFVVLQAIPYRRACATLSQPEAVRIARDNISKRIDMVAKTLGENKEDLEKAELVQFVNWGDQGVYSYSVTFRAAQGGLVAVHISAVCGFEFSFPEAVVPPI